MRRRRRPRWGFLCPALALLAAASVRPDPTRAADDPVGAAQGVLDARVRAVLAGDRAAFLATVDPRAPRPFLEAQVRWFEGFRALPLAGFALRVRTDDTGDLGGTALSGRYGGDRVLLPETRQVWRLRGYDDRDAVEALWLTFVQRGGRWYVGGDADLEDVGLDSARNLWDLGRVQVQTTDHFLVVSHPEQAGRAAGLAAMAEEAMAALGREWDHPWSARLPLVLPGSVDELERLLQSTIDLDKFVAFVSYGVVRDDGYEASAPRLFVQDRNLSRYGRPFQVQTLLHELSHAAAVPLVGPFIPAWTHEGVSDWLARGRPAGERRPRGGDDRLPRDHELTTGSAASILRAYAESRSAVSFLATRTGPGGPTALLAALGRPRVEPGSVDFHVDAALRGVAGISLRDFEREWAGR